MCGDGFLEPVLGRGVEHGVEPTQLELQVARRVDLGQRLRRGALGDADPALGEQESDGKGSERRDQRHCGEEWEGADTRNRCHAGDAAHRDPGEKEAAAAP